jgi:hypothetical protein
MAEALCIIGQGRSFDLSTVYLLATGVLLWTEGFIVTIPLS